MRWILKKKNDAKNIFLFLIGALLGLLIGILIPLKLNLGCFKISNKKIDNSYQEDSKINVSEFEFEIDNQLISVFFHTPYYCQFCKNGFAKNEYLIRHKYDYHFEEFQKDVNDFRRLSDTDSILKKEMEESQFLFPQ